MKNITEWTRNLPALAGVLALGYWLGGSRTVKAATSDIQFQLVDVKATSALLVYQPSAKTVYVYQGATGGGSSNLQCSFKYVPDTPGGPIQRVSCPVKTLLP